VNTRRIASALAICMAAGSITLVVGCGSSDSASTAAADTAATSTGTTSTTGTATWSSVSRTMTRWLRMKPY
jgi:fructoselysine-6-P-deglycase FrlB-like protein